MDEVEKDVHIDSRALRKNVFQVLEMKQHNEIEIEN